MDIQVVWISVDGAEHEERWPSVECFRAWALAERIRCSWRAYAEDADGEWELTDEGRL